MTNVDPVPRDEIDDERMVEFLRRAQVDGVGSWLVRLLAHAPAQGVPLLTMLDVVNGGNELPGRLRHLVRLLLAQMAGDPYTSAVNERPLLADGLPAELLAELRWRYADAAELSEAEQVALRYAEQMFLDAKQIGDAEYDELRLHFTEPQIMRLAVITGVNYAMSKLLRTTGATAADDAS